MERRTFVKTAGLAALGAWSGTGGLRAETPVADLVVPGDGYRPPDWLRYARTVYFDGYSPPVYPRLDDFDADRLVRCVVDLGCDTLRFQPVGQWAYFPTRSGYPIHPDLKGRDFIAETLAACRKAGLHVYLYTTYFNPFLPLSYLEKHPEYLDWVVRGPDGKPWGMTDGSDGTRPWTPKADATGDAYRNAVRRIVEEFCAYEADGAYFDAPGCLAYSGFCYCGTCRRKFKAYSGLDMDRLQDPADQEARIIWYRWFGDLQLEDLFLFRRQLHESGKFMLCHNGAAWRPQAIRQQYRIPEGFMVENQDQVYRRILAGLMGAAMARPTRKLYQMYMGGFTLSSPGLPAHSPVHLEDTSDEDDEEVLMEGFTNLACGAAPIYGTLNRLYYGLGSGSPDLVKEVFHTMREAEPILKDSAPVHEVTLVPSWEALQLWRTNRVSGNIAMNEGFTLAMLEEHFALDVCPSTEITAEWLRNRRVLALCGASGITDELAELIADWVARGGALLATYDTGLFDGEGRVRSGGALEKVLGVKMTGEPPPPETECYYRVQVEHPALGDYRSGDKLKADPRWVPVVATGQAQVLADCWNLGTGRVRGPAIIANTYGRGRTLYIAGSPEAHYATSRVASHRRLLASAVRFLAGAAPRPYTLEAPRGVYGLLRRASNGDLSFWILANVGFKDADIGRMRQEFTPVADVNVGIRIPEGRKVRAIHRLRDQGAVPFVMAGDYAQLTLSWVRIAEALHIELV